jgi:hypothetical protein
MAGACQGGRVRAVRDVFPSAAARGAAQTVALAQRQHHPIVTCGVCLRLAAAGEWAARASDHSASIHAIHPAVARDFLSAEDLDFQ